MYKKTSKFKKYLKASFSLLILFSLYSCKDQANGNSILTIYTYSSFVSKYGPGSFLKEKFEKECSCSLNFISSEDGVSLLNRLKSEVENTKADVVLGFDSNLQENALKTSMFLKHDLVLPKFSLDKWENDFFIPFDYSYFALIYDKSKISKKITNFNDFLNSDLTLIYQDPRTSTLGLGFLLWLNKLYPNDMQNIWKKIAAKTITIPSGWSEAYGLFLKGESSTVLSYTTSPLYHLLYENEDKYQAMIFDEGHYLQIELAGIVKTTKNKDLAKMFLEFLLKPENQEILAYKNIMYPVLDLNEIDDITNEKVKFKDILTPKKQLTLDGGLIYKNLDKWINVWQENILNE